MTHALTQRRPPVLLAAALLCFLTSAALAQGGGRRLRTVAYGPMRAVVTAQGVQLRPSEAVADRVIVQFRRGVSGSGRLRSLGAAQGRLGRHLGHGQYLVELPEGTSLGSALAALHAQPEVALAAADQIVYPARVPNDPEYSKQYHLPLVNAPGGWDRTTGTAVIIADVDSGVDLDHPDLASKIWTNPGEVPNNGRDDDGNGFVDDVHGWDFYAENNDPNPSPDGKDENYDGTPDEQVSHGTLVSGLAAAATDNGVGGAGISWGALIMPLQVFPDDGGSAVSTVVEAINYAVAMGAQVINLSIGGGYSEAFTESIAAAYDAGVVVVAAGGNSRRELTNSSSTWESPVCNDGADVFAENHIIGVAATDRADRKASYSNYDSSSANFIDLAAPGDGVYGPFAYFPDFPGLTSYYGTNSGTSFSCPLVSGLAALVLSRQPDATPAQVLQTILQGCDNIDAANPGYIGKLGAGRMNVARTLGVAVPPAAVLDLAATDTPGDDGGSLSVSWRKSPDDGAGANSVVSYSVWRRTAVAAYANVSGDLPPGTEQFLDTSVSDGSEYFYKVRTSDGTLSSDTAEVGPATSRNDAPPPVVTGLAVADVPGDSGGAVRLRWDAYSAPADFYAFTIYRSTKTFTGTTAMVPISTVQAPAVTEYTDTTVADGVDYFYAVGTRDNFDNENRDVAAVGPVQSFPNGTVTFAAGLHFFGSPVVPPSPDPAALFGVAPGEFQCARWLTDGNAYERYAAPGASANMDLALGRGFWVNLAAPAQVSPTGVSAPAGDFSIALTPGWHMVGNPYFSPINFGETTVTYNGSTMDLDSADGAGVLSAFAWMYNGTTGSYELAYPQLGGGSHQVPPWQAIWVLAHKNCTMTLLRPLDSSQAPAAASGPVQTTLAAQVNWVLPVVVSSGTGRSLCTLGTANRELLGAEPPPARPGVRVAAAAPGSQDDYRYAVALAETGPASINWGLRVTAAQAGQPVRLTTPDLSALPPDRTVLLEDLATGKRVYLRTASGYEFTPRSGEAARQFRITVSPRGAGQLALSGVQVQATPGAGAQVVFTLSQPANCTVTIMNLAGRPVRVVEQDTLRAAGANTVLWDGRSQTGTLTPGGTYLLVVEARNDEGARVRGMGSLAWRR